MQAVPLPHVIPHRLRLRAFGFLWLTGGVLAYAMLALGAVPHGRATTLVLASVAAGWGSAMLLGVFDRFGAWYQHVAVVGVVWIILAAYIVIGDAASDIRLFFAWSVPYCTLFFGRRAMWAHLLHADAALVLGLAAIGGKPPLLVSTYLSATALMAVTAVLVAWAANLAESSRGLLQHQAEHDALTGLPNRRLLHRLLQRSLETPGTHTAVMLIDLDSFKMINDTHGHEVGDSLLRQVSTRLQDTVTPGDVLARLGGDEFALVVSESGGAARFDRRLATLEQRLASAWRNVLPVAGGLYTSGCCGVSVAAHPDVTPGDLLREADVALYQAKAVGRGSVRHYDDGLRDHTRRRLSIETGLRDALINGGLDVAYQPVVTLNDERPVGAEALCRWTHPMLGAVAPQEFIPVAEESGLIGELTDRVVVSALHDLKNWMCSGLVDETFRLAVNISPTSVRPGLASHLAALVADSAVPAQMLALELTESVLMADDPSVGGELDLLRAAGHPLLLDDFGTGYSALSYLSRLPVDVLKLDRSFIARLTGDTDQWVVVAAVVQMAHALGLAIVAEGVETPEQAQRLLELGCQRAQGWLYGRPMKSEDFATSCLAGRGEIVALPH